MSTSHFTLGIEEEFQSIDNLSGELRSSIATLFAKGQTLFGEKLHREWAQSMVELTTSICSDIPAVRSELYQTRTLLKQLMQSEGLLPISAGTHPTALWQTQDKTELPRYNYLEQEYQDVVRMRVLFGLHVHVGGIDDKATALTLINQLRTWLPHLLALSTNSPFWAGRFTGIKSYRTIVWQSNMPRCGLQDIIPSLDEFNRYIDDLIATRCITSGKDLWWYIRPHLTYNTIEFRICDMPATIEDTIALAALCQALVAKLAWLHEHNQNVPALPRHYIEENLWRATRYGLDATVADFTARSNVPMRAAIHELLDFVDDVAIDFGTTGEMAFLRTLLENPRGTGADRQIAAYQQREDIQDVIDLLIQETLQGIEQIPSLPVDQGQVYPGSETVLL